MSFQARVDEDPGRRPIELIRDEFERLHGIECVDPASGLRSAPNSLDGDCPCTGGRWRALQRSAHAKRDPGRQTAGGDSKLDPAQLGLGIQLFIHGGTQRHRLPRHRKQRYTLGIDDVVAFCRRPRLVGGIDGEPALPHAGWCAAQPSSGSEFNAGRECAGSR